MKRIVTLRLACVVAIVFLGSFASPARAAVSAVAAGGSHSLFVNADGTLWGMGGNGSGELGDGTRADRVFPVQAAIGVGFVAAGGGWSLFVKTDATLWAMGDNTFGELGDGTTIQRAFPVQVATGVSSVVTGGLCSLFVKTDGTLWAMGGNTYGQLGDGTTTSRRFPVRVSTGVSAVSAGAGHSLFVKSDGTLWAMGANPAGQLGDGTTTNRTSPVQVATGVRSIAAGGGFSMYVKTDGTLWAVGGNLYGQLGNGTTANRSSAVQVATGVSSVAAGEGSCLFVKTDGTLWAMGDNTYGQLGDGTTIQRNSPVQVASGVNVVSSGAHHSLFVKTDGTLWAMGWNENYQLGDGTKINRSTPVSGQAPTITTQPSAQVVASGGSASFSAVATGSTPLTYQWFKNSSPVTGATSGTLSFASVQLTDAGGYTVVITNGAGSVTSNAATLTVTPALPQGQSQTAQVVVHGKSVQLSPSAPLFVSGYGNITTYYSTFNGTSGPFLLDTGSVAVSGELRPRANSSGLYEGSYAQITPSVVFDYGSYVVSVPTTDTDGNGIPDVLQYDRNGTFTATGSGFSVAAGVTFSASLAFTRSAGSANGSYLATTVNSLGQGNTVSGSYALISYQGTISYTRATVNTLALSVTGLFQGGVTLTGSTTYTTSGVNQLSYAAFTVRAPDGTAYQVKAGTLARSGNKYRGTLSLVDGMPQTYWPDFTDSVLEITDANDANGDGVPDLTDTTYTTVGQAPTITTQPSAQVVTVGGSVTFSVVSTGTAPLTYQWLKDGAAISGATNATLNLSNVQLIGAGNYSVVVANASGTVTSNAATLTVNTVLIPPTTTSPVSLTVSAGATASLNVVVSGTGPQSYQWIKDGAAIAGATSATLTLTNVQPTNAGIYTTLIVNSSGNTISDPAVVGVMTTSKVIGSGSEVGADIPHPNGNIFDQVLITGAAATVTAEGKKVTRTSFIDLTNDIVQVEFSGAGTLSLVLDNPSGPALPVNYTQAVNYMKGHAGIVITGADDTTNVSVFTVGRATAFDPTGAFNILLPISSTNDPLKNGSSLFQGHVVYDGIADLAFIAISSANGKFGGLRASNASFFATKSLTGVYAPGVQFQGPVFIGDISAFDAATPVIIIGSSPDTRITGGDLLQANGQPVKVSGLTQLKFTAGGDSNGNVLTAKTNRATLQQSGTDVTSQIVVNPGP